MEVDVGSVKIAKEIFKEIKVIRKMLSDWQKGVDKMIENKNSKKTKQKSSSTTIITFPALISSIASSILFNFVFIPYMF